MLIRFIHGKPIYLFLKCIIIGNHKFPSTVWCLKHIEWNTKHQRTESCNLHKLLFPQSRNMSYKNDLSTCKNIWLTCIMQVCFFLLVQPGYQAFVLDLSHILYQYLKHQKKKATVYPWILHPQAEILRERARSRQAGRQGPYHHAQIQLLLKMFSLQFLLWTPWA